MTAIKAAAAMSLTMLNFAVLIKVSLGVIMLQPQLTGNWLSQLVELNRIKLLQQVKPNQANINEAGSFDYLIKIHWNVVYYIVVLCIATLYISHIHLFIWEIISVVQIWSLSDRGSRMKVFWNKCAEMCLWYWHLTVILHYNDVIMGSMASQITSLTFGYSAVYSGADQRKHQSSVSLAFVRGIHRGPVNSPHKWPVTRKMFLFDDVIMCDTKLKNDLLSVVVYIQQLTWKLVDLLKQPITKWRMLRFQVSPWGRVQVIPFLCYNAWENYCILLAMMAAK